MITPETLLFLTAEFVVVFLGAALGAYFGRKK